MRRHRETPRSDWPSVVASMGLTYHTHETGPYWDESASYELTSAEVTALEEAARTLHFLCINAAEAVIKNNWWNRLSIPEKAIPAILRSWDADDFSLYGRFDLAFNEGSPPKLLEYNADTPTALVEAAVTQWFWLRDKHPEADQFNSIHERLIEAWRRWGGSTIHFSSIKDHAEDEQTVAYLRDTCEQAGVATEFVYIEDLGWDSQRKQFVDLREQPVSHWFKLYPWEWLWHETFGDHLLHQPTHCIEPAWKMLLSNKGLLPVLWELFPDHPNLLPAFETSDPLGSSFVRKPRLSREGANIAFVENGVAVLETTGDYGEDGYVFQAIADAPNHEGNFPVFGVWIVDHEPAGLGIREDSTRITGNLSRFVPHYFRNG
jgi:glutathionylspermidine synthase